MKIIAGVKSKGQNEVGIIDFTILYKGSIILERNLGLNLIQRIESQDKITSKIIRYKSISVKKIIVNEIISNIIYFIIF